MAAPLAVCVSQCSAADIKSTDAGEPDASYGYDAQSDAFGACGPLDVTTYAPTTMHPPNPAHAGKCTLQQSSDFAACEGGDTSKCSQFAPGQAAEACGACIDTHAPDATWGVVVFDGSLGTINIEGCVDDALQEVAEELAKNGSGSCGDRLHASYGCQDAACGACSGDDLTTCVDSALQGACQSFDQKVESTTGPCAALLGDASPADVASCFPDPSIDDLVARRADFLTRMANYMCGPQT